MSRLFLSVPVEITVQDGKKDKVLKVEIKEPTKKDRKEYKELVKKFEKITSRLNKIATKLESATKKRDFLEKLEKFEDALKEQEKIDSLVAEQDELEKEIDAIGGDDFYETKARERFEKYVSGKDKEQLVEIAEQKDYITVMQALDVAKADAEKKALKK